MIDTDSKDWGYTDEIKKFLATQTMQIVKRKDPGAIPYYVTLFQSGAQSDAILEQHREWFEAAMKEYGS